MKSFSTQNSKIRHCAGLAIGLSFASLFQGCASGTETALEKGFSANSRSKNVAVLMSGSHEQHIPKNVGMIREVLSDPGAGYNFTIVERQKVTNEQAVETTMEAAKQVGDGGTLLWYFSSHGAPNGALRTFSRQLKLKQITDGIIAARGGVPLKRLVVIVQACFSGQIVNGSAAIQRSTGGPVSDDGTFMPNQYMTQLFNDNEAVDITNSDSNYSPKYGQLAEQLLVMSASAKSQYSMYSGDGSHFTKALYKTFKTFGNSHGTTMRTFLEAVQKNVRSSKPQYRAEPESLILDEPLHNPTSDSPSNAIYLKLGDSNPERPVIFAAVNSDVQTMGYCLGGREECSSQSSFLSMNPVSNLSNGMRIFSTTQQINLINAMKITFAATPETAGLKRTITLKRRQ